MPPAITGAVTGSPSVVLAPHSFSTALALSSASRGDTLPATWDCQSIFRPARSETGVLPDRFALCLKVGQSGGAAAVSIFPEPYAGPFSSGRPAGLSCRGAIKVSRSCGKVSPRAPRFRFERANFRMACAEISVLRGHGWRYAERMKSRMFN